MPRAHSAVTLWAVVMCVGCALPESSHAIGVPKSIKDKAAKAVGQKAGVTDHAAGQNVEFTDVLLELTDERLDKILAGVHAAEATNKEHAVLVARKQRLLQEEADLLDKYGEAINAAQLKHDAAETCFEEELHERANKRSDEIGKRAMSDPALRQKYIEMGQRMGMAHATGDSVALSKVQAEMLSLLAPTREDSLAASKKCGPVPPLHPQAARLGGVREESGSIDASLRENEDQGNKLMSGGSGLTQEQFGMARERIEMYLASIRNQETPTGFTSNELSSLSSHREALSAAF